MKKLILIIMVITLNKVILFSQNRNNFSVIDSISLFNKVDSLKLEGHTEFYLSVYNVLYGMDEELNLIIDKLGNKIYPEGFVLYYLSKGFYPKTEYMSNDTYKYFNKTFIYIDKKVSETNVYLLTSSPKLKRVFN